MSIFEAVMIVSGFFILRFVVPLVAAVAVCRCLNQIQDRWGAPART